MREDIEDTGKAIGITTDHGLDQPQRAQEGNIVSIREENEKNPTKISHHEISQKVY
jgi:hypothetical protein